MNTAYRTGLSTAPSRSGAKLTRACVTRTVNVVMRTASLLISLREAARKVLNFAQPIILACIWNLRLSKIFPPFGRRVAVCALRQNKINVDYCARTPL